VNPSSPFKPLQAPSSPFKPLQNGILGLFSDPQGIN